MITLPSPPYPTVTLSALFADMKRINDHMAKRNRWSLTPKPLDQAFAPIDTLERAVIAANVGTAVHSAQALVRWLYPDNVVDKLMSAYPYTRELDRGSTIVDTVKSVHGFDLSINIKASAVPMLVPEPGAYVQLNPERGDGDNVLQTLGVMWEQHTQFEKLRYVVRWLNENATIGAARYYAPWLLGILPAEHAFHTAGGQVFREPKRPLGEIADTMRECGAIMASALLCRNRDTSGPKPDAEIAFHGRRVNCSLSSDGTLASASYVSNRFQLGVKA